MSCKNISKRLIQARKDKGFSQAEWARRLEMKDYQVRDMERGKTSPSIEMVQAVVENFHVDAQWLLGETPRNSGIAKSGASCEADVLDDENLIRELQNRLESRSKHSVSEPVLVWGDRSKVERHEALDNYRTVPLMASAAAAGQGRVIDEEIESWAIIHDSIVPEGHEVRAVRVEGDSMEPLLPEGTIVAVDLSVDDPASVDGHMAVAQRDSEVVIKWWMCHDHCVTLESENSAYGAIVLEPGEEENALIGQVVWAWQNLRDLRRHQ